VDGLLLAPSPGFGEHARPYLAAQAVPVVLFDRFWDAPLDQVGSENERPTAQLVGHLAELGHRRIAMVAGMAGLSTTRERLRGYELGLERAELAVDPALIVPGESQRDAARAATARLLDLRDPPTAIVSGNNFMTIGVMRTLTARGVRVPNDMALVGFDDFDWADLFHPRLTVIAQPAAEVGRQAVELLRSRLEDPDRPPRTRRLPATFVHRESCGCGRELPM
jgi:LacI family transcriptional regulator